MKSQQDKDEDLGQSARQLLRRSKGWGQSRGKAQTVSFFGADRKGGGMKPADRAAPHFCLFKCVFFLDAGGTEGS